jgi:lysophospholipase L1-like esterase
LTKRIVQLNEAEMTRTAFILILALAVSTSCQNNEPFAIYTIGDSTMANKKVEVYPETGWCQVLPEFFDSLATIKNHAVNGRSSKSFINEGRWQTVLDSLKPGDYLFIQFGHNDEKEYDSTRYTTPYGTYSENLEMFVRMSRGKGAKPVLFTPIVRRKFGDDKKLVDTHGDYPVAARKVAAELMVPLIDLQKLTEDWVNSLGGEPSKTMFLWTGPNEKFPEGRRDDTHLSEVGARQVAKLAMESAKEQNLAFSAYIIEY